ncbi:putative peptide synthetase [Schizophyllum fasciatum]
MAALPATRVPCFYPSPQTTTSGGIDVVHHHFDAATDSAPETRYRACAATVRALLGTTGEFAFRVGDQQVAVVEGVDEPGAPEAFKIVDAASAEGLDGIEVKFSAGEDPTEKGANFHIIDTSKDVKIAYARANVPKDLVSRLLAHYIGQVTANPIHQQDDSPASLSILNHPPRFYPADNRAPALLHAPFLLSARARPNHVAVDYLGSEDDERQRQTISYGELDARSAALASILRAGDGMRNSVVPFLLPASIEIYVAYLGILRAGKAFSPLPTLDGAPVSRVQELIADVGAKVIVGRGERPSWLDKGVEWIDVADVQSLLKRAARVEDDYDEFGQSPEDLAYILFTSGSTGKPKGVQITHRAASTSIHGHLSVRRVAPSARWFQFAAATFDPSVMEIFCTLACGATLLSAYRPRFLSDADKVLGELGATNMMATPSMAAVLKAERIGALEIREKTCGPVADDLEYAFELWTMGEKLSGRVIHEFDRPPRFLVWNAYGPTEASINVTLRKHPRGESGSRLGPPIPTASMLVLHPTEARAVEHGFPGELALGGVQVARGYLNNPDQTARVFVEISGVGRVYRTGDWARTVVGRNGEWSEIEYLGRMGVDQVKLSGRRVELGEIDAVLGQVPGVQAAYSVVVEGRLLALVVPEDSLINDSDAVKAQLAGKLREQADVHLPLHMRPSNYYFATETPRSSSGKADRRAIARIVAERESARESTQEESSYDTSGESEAMTLVRRLVSEATEVPPSAVTPHSNLLRLGVDSLKAVRLLYLLRQAEAEDLALLNVTDILSCSTPADILAAAASKTSVDDAMPALKSEQVIAEFRVAARRTLGSKEASSVEIWPATPMQAGVLALYLRSADANGYINHSVFHLAPDVSVPRLKEAWAQVVNKNKILRAKFVLVDQSELSPFAVVVEETAKIEWIEDRESESLDRYLAESPKRISPEHPWSVAILGGDESPTFVLTLHHALFDGASLALLLEELHAYYNENVDLPRTGFEHSVYDALAVDTEKATVFWKDVLQGFSPDPFPDLTGLRAYAKATSPVFTVDLCPTHHAATVISRNTFSHLQLKSRELETTPLAVVQAAWAQLLLSYSESDEPDIVFGSLVGGRTTDALELAVGPVFTAVPIRVQAGKGGRGVCASASTKDVLAQLRDMNIKSMRHRYPPVSVLSGPNGIIYDTTIALQNFSLGKSQTDLWTKAEYPPMVTEFAAVLEIWPEADDFIRLRLTGSNNVLTPDASRTLLQQFDDVVAAILVRPPQETLATSLTAIRPELQAAVNTVPTPVETPTPNTLIHHHFEANAREHPDSVAVWFKTDLARPDADLRFTYAELDARANQLANLLLATYGDLTDQAVPLCMEKSPELYVAILGVLKAGGAWCPVDAQAPEVRKKDLFVRAGGPVVLVRNAAGFEEHCAALSGDLQMLALDDLKINQQSKEKPSVRTTVEDLAYLIWTSGTTGAPKASNICQTLLTSGVPIQHKAAVQSLTVLQEVIPFGPDPVFCLNFSAYTFDVSVLDVFYALGKSCGTLCSAYKDILVGQFAEVVNAFQATHAFLTPAFMAQSSLAECKTLQSLISIGEKLPDTVADKWCRPETVSLNTYGPAEATIIATYRRWEPQEATKAHNVGFPIQTVSCFAVKDDLVLPRGAVGELALGGYQNARGYHRQPDMTAKKFVEHTVAGKVYLTGDIVRFLHDGSIEFVGRHDDLVKLGGIRVELSEISTALEGCHPLAAEVATLQLSRPDRPQKTLCSFIAASSLDSPVPVCTGSDAREVAVAAMKRADEMLPGFMHPSVYIVVKRIPHTASNKVDRKALADFYSTMDISTWEEALAQVTGRLEDDSWSPLATTIRNAVADLTGTPAERIKKTTPLSALGVDSIRALQLASRLRKAGSSISVGDILNHPTIQRLVNSSDRKADMSHSTSEWCDTFNQKWRPVVSRAMPGHNVERVIPCTPLQEGMLGETIKDPAAYWSHRLFYLGDNCNVDKLIDAWKSLASKTEALRLAFAPAATYGAAVDADNGCRVFVQILLSNPKFRIRREPGLSADNARDLARTLATSLARSTVPLWAVTIIGEDVGTPAMLLSMHHALYDGHAYKLLLDDVVQAYESQDVTSRLQLTSAISRAFFPEDPKKSLSLWEEVLTPFADAYSRPFPDLSDGSYPTTAGFTTRDFELDRASLSEASSRFDASIAQILQFAWATVLGAYLQTEKVVFGETRSLRFDDALLEGAVAPMIATLPVPVDVSATLPVRQALATFVERTSGGRSWSFLSLQHVRRVLRRPLDQVLFPTIFVMNSVETPDTGSQLASRLWREAGELTNLTVEHPLAINVYVSSDRISVHVSGSNQTIPEDNVQLLAEQFEAAVQAVLSDTDLPVSELLAQRKDILSIVESPCPDSASARLPNEMQGSERSFVHRLRELARDRPDSVAVASYEGVNVQEWTYEHLEERSNQVARWINEYHRKAKVIATALPNCHIAYPYILGILKSGKTYLAVGNSGPSSRRRLRLRSARADLVFVAASDANDLSPLPMSRIVVVDDRTHEEEVRDADVGPVDLELNGTAYITFEGAHASSTQASLVSHQSLDNATSALSSWLSTETLLSWMPIDASMHLVELLAALSNGTRIAVVSPRRLAVDGFRKPEDLPQLRRLLLAGMLPTIKARRPVLIIVIGVHSVSSSIKDWVTAADREVLNIFGTPEFAGLCTLGRFCSHPRDIGHPRDGLIAVLTRIGHPAQVALRGEVGVSLIAYHPLERFPDYSKELHFLGEHVDWRKSCGHRNTLNASSGSLTDTGLLARVNCKNVRTLWPSVHLSDISQAVASVSRQALPIITLALEHPQGMQSYIVTFVARRSAIDMGAGAAGLSVNDQPLARALLTSCRQRLPSHLTPDIVMPVTSMPLESIASGAVDKRCLRRLFYSYSLSDINSQRSNDAVATRPLSEKERRIREILSSLTRVPAEAIQATTTTLELGVDSLSAISLSFKLKDAGFFVPPYVILAGPSLEKLSKASGAAADAINVHVDWEVTPDVQKEALDHAEFAVEAVLPCLPLQEGLVALTLNSPESIYVNHFVTVLDEATDVDRLKLAVQATVFANPALRTCFYPAKDSIVQLVLSPNDTCFQWRSVHVADEQALDRLHAESDDVAKDVVTQISRVPPVRFGVYSGNGQRTCVCWTLHHSVYDGESLPMIMSEVRRRYAGTFHLKRPSVVKLLQYLSRQSSESARAFYTEYLHNAPRQLATTGAPGESKHHRIRLETSLSALEKKARTSNASLHALALSAFGTALAEYRKRNDAVFGVVLSGRTVDVDGIADMLAPCITTVPMRVRYTEEPLFRDVVAQVQGDMEHVMEHQHTPLRHIQRWLARPEPLFDALFNFVRQSSSKELDADEPALWDSLEGKATLDYSLAVAIEADAAEDAVYIRAGHLPNFGSTASVKGLMQRVSELLQHPEQSLPSYDDPLVSQESLSQPKFDDSSWSEAETLIKGVVAQLCNVDPSVITKDLSFLQLGIDSITSIRLAQSLRSRGLSVPTHAIMRHPCVGALAQFLRETPAEGTVVAANREFEETEGRLRDTYRDSIPLLDDADKIVSVFPTTPLQTGMLTETLSSGGRLYLVPHALRLDSSVQIDNLRVAIEKVVASTDILRCTFHAVAEDKYPWITAVHALAPLRWMEYEFTSAEELHVKASKIVETEILSDEKSFERPPMSLHFLHSADIRVLLLLMHHSLYDGLSLPYILGDIATYYQGVEPTPRPQFTAAVPHILYSSKDRANFWSKHLAGFMPAPLPTTNAPANKTHLARLPFALPAGALQTVKDMDVTVQAVALLGWGKVLATLARSTDVVFGQVVAGRAIELEDALYASGPLFNTVPFRFYLADPTWSNTEAAQVQQQANVQIEPHQHVPLRKIQKDWRLQNQTGGAVLFDTLFVFQQVGEKKQDRSHLWQPYEISDEPTSAQYPLSLEIVHNGDKMELRAGCQSNVFSQEELADMLETLKDTIVDIVARPDACVISCPPALKAVLDAPRPPPRSSPTADTAEPDRDFTPNERILRDVFAEVSKIPVERIGLNTPLYALGLDSVAAIQISARCKKHGLPILVADVFQGETVMGVCAVFEERARALNGAPDSVHEGELLPPEVKDAALRLLGLADDDVEDVLPVLAGQEYHLASWLASGGTFYQPVFVYKFNATVDPERLREAWRALQQRHSILRTAFAATSPSTVAQVVLKAVGEGDWEFIARQGDLSGAVRAQVQAEYDTPADLRRPPARGKLLRIDGQDILLLSLHHATYDAWSVPLLVADLCALYRGESCRSATDFSGLVKHLASYSPDESAARDLWRTAVGTQATLLPCARPELGMKQVFARASGVVSSVSALQAKCQSAGLSVQGLVLAVWGRIVASLVASPRPVVGVYHTGRSAAFEHVDVLAGPTVNVLPMRLPGRGDVPIRDAARELQAEMGRRTAHEQTRLRDIASWTLGEGRGAIFNVWLNLLWHGDKIRTMRKGSESLLESFSVGPPTDFISAKPFAELRSSVDALDVSYLPAHGFFVDVVLNAETDSIGLAMRSQEALLDEKDLQKVIDMFASGVREAVDELQA